MNIIRYAQRNSSIVFDAGQGSAGQRANPGFTIVPRRPPPPPPGTSAVYTEACMTMMYSILRIQTTELLAPAGTVPGMHSKKRKTAVGAGNHAITHNTAAAFVASLQI